MLLQTFSFNFGGLLFLINQLLGFIVDVLIFFLNLLFAIFIFLWNTMVVIVQTVWRGLRALGRLIRPLYDHVLRPFLRILRTVFAKIQVILAGVLRPALLALQCVNQALDILYNRILRPISQVFFLLRTWLRVLRIFAPKLARRLDQRIGKIEQKIFGGFFRIRAFVNNAITWINRLVTFDGLLQRVPFIGAVLRDLELLLRIFDLARLDVLDILQIRTLNAQERGIDVDAVLDRIRKSRPARRQMTPAEQAQELVDLIP